MGRFTHMRLGRIYGEGFLGLVWKQPRDGHFRDDAVVFDREVGMEAQYQVVYSSIKLSKHLTSLPPSSLSRP